MIDLGWGVTLVIPGATKLLGSGKFGEVVLGQLKRMNNDEEEVNMVAVKRLRGSRIKDVIFFFNMILKAKLDF